MNKNIEEIVNSLKLIFRHKNGLLLELDNSKLVTAVPHKLYLDENDNVIVVVSDDGTVNVIELNVNSIVSVTEVADLNVPNNVSSTTEFWSSRFFSLPTGYVSFPSVKASEHSAVISEYSVSIGEQLQAEKSMDSLLITVQDRLKESENLITAQDRFTVQIKAAKVGVAIFVLLIFGISAVFVNVFNNNYIALSNSDPGYQEASAEYEKNFEEWVKNSNREDYYNNDTVEMPLDSTVTLTEYDYYSW